MNRLVIILSLSFISFVSLSTTTTATSSGDWANGSTWDNGAPGCGDTVIIPSGYTVTVYSSVFLDEVSTPACSTATVINVAGTLYFQGGDTTTMYLACNSVINVATGGTVDGEGNRKYIDICQTEVWNASQGPITGDTTLLPVTYISFDANWSDNNNSVEISWSTASELNNDYFEVQRSSDVIDWELIGEITGSGNSNIVLNYNYVDYFPYYDKTSYYRLKQVDYDGVFEYSKIVALTANNENNLNGSINVYPNPVSKNNILFIELENDISFLPKVKFYSIDNKLIELNYTISKNKILVNTNNFIPGIYFIRISIGNNSYKNKLVVY